jgi:diguanylate cyclase (GGDEF)-like protein
MKNYNIAVIIAGIDEGYQSTILRGIESFTSANHINVAVFVSFSGIMRNQRHDVGEFNIFNLPDFSRFDGVIMLTNTIACQSVTNYIINKLIDTGVPVVSIDNNIPGFYHIGIDNRKAMRKITEHFIHEHNCRVFNYISGPEDNPESTERLETFLDVLRENGIIIEGQRIYYGDFRPPSGRDAISYFLESDMPMPQAIICANDAMAVSAMTALNSAGIRVPEDILISGFDNTYTDENCTTKLTSVERPLRHSGELACQILLNHWNGISQERSIVLDMHPIFTESCGCMSKDESETDIDTIKQLNYKKQVTSELTSYYLSFMNRMSCQLVECDTLSEYTHALQPFISEIKAEEFYLCLCSNWDYDTETFARSGLSITEYTDKMLVPIACRNGVFSELPDFPVSEILPDMFKEHEKSKFYYFMPIHFRERCLGYIALMNSLLPIDSSIFQTWGITISNMLENVRKIISLDYAVQKLNKLYTVDTLSDIYNRNGFIKGTSELFEQCIKHKKPVMLMFIDMDRLKFINDNYGHSAGDDAIYKIAYAIRKSCTDNEVCCRFGGDEFIIFAADYTDSDAEAITLKIQKNIDTINATDQLPYQLSASTGYYITTPVEGDDIFNLVTVADNIMYESKKKKKLSKYLKTDTEFEIRNVFQEGIN